jgi:ELWxxDGT repeat protein
MTLMNDSLYFNGINSLNIIASNELWKSDGTSAGTVLVKDINPNSYQGSGIKYLTNVNDTLYFSASNGVNGHELWMSDGTSAGTVMVGDIYPGNSNSYPQYLTNVNGTLFFTANNNILGTELWVSDGTNAGTMLVKDIAYSNNSSYPNYLVDVNGTLFFTADDRVNGEELWKSDGTSTGTVMVKDITANSFDSRPRNLTNVNGTLFFSANDSGTNGTELWKSDGTTAGTVLVKDINPNGHTVFNNFYAFKGELFFSANDGVNGMELWKSDGTATGTILMKNINTGSASSMPGYFFAADDTLYFSADNGVNGTELWKTDGTIAIVELAADIQSGPSSSFPTNLINVSGRGLFFSATTPAYGRELWRFGACLSTTAIDSIIACNSYTWIDGITYTQSIKTAKDTLVNAAGCDSIVTLNLKINNTTNGIDTIAACETFTWIDGITYTSSNNTAIDTLINTVGCDSIISLDLTINSPTTATDVQTACKSFTWIDGITYTSNNNTAIDTLQNKAGCDSIVTLDLTINVADTSTSVNQDTMIANAVGAAYQWLDCNNNYAAIPNATAKQFIPTEGGSYAVEVTENGCTDTSFCMVSTVGLSENWLATQLSIFPNPVSDQLHLKSLHVKIINVVVLDVKGSIVKRLDGNIQLINTSDLRKGVYHLRISTTEGVVYKKIIKM